MLEKMFLTLLLAVPAAAVSATDEKGALAGAGKLNQPIGTGEVLQVFLALVFVLLMIGAAAWLLRRFSAAGFSRQGALRLLASVSVGQRERIVLVQAGETQLLLGVAQGSVRTLHVFDKPVMLDGGEPQGGERFAERLTAALQRRGGERQ
jgi:flagellar protein FliO/FliZ